MSFIKHISPLVEDLGSYSKAKFWADVIAGLTVGVMFIPQSMAYAVLAGLPPIYGLYGGLIPLFLYALLGSSRHLSVGPVAVSAILIAEGISKIAEPLSSEFVSFAILAALMIGILQVIFSVLRLGFFVKYLSHSVIAGFTSAAAIIIFASQLKDLLGISIPRFHHLHETITYAGSHLQEINLVAFVMCVCAIVIMLVLKKKKPKIPSALVVVILGTLLSYSLNLTQYGLEIVGQVPSGLPDFELPYINFDNIKALLPTVFTVTIIGIVESIGIAKAIESKHDYYEVRPNQELFALGIAKIGGAFFQGLPTSGSFTRSAINNEAGAKTAVSSLITVVLIVLTLLFLTPIFYYLPKAILAAIILLAVRSLLEYQEAKHLWQVDKPNFVVMMMTFICVLILGIELGVMIGVVFSLVMKWALKRAE